MIRYISIHVLMLLFWSTSSLASLSSEWAYSKASVALEKGDYAQAQELLRTMLADDPYRPDLLYDLGVASYKNKEYQQAHAYFTSAAQAEHCSASLQEQALFNGGNASVQLNELNDAIVQYERVLELNEENEYAKHNLEQVKKMLDEQQQSPQENDDKKDDQQNNDQKKDQQDQKQNKQDPNQGGDQKKDQQDSSKGDDGQNESDSQDEQGEENKNNTKQNKGGDKDKHEQDKQQNANDEMKNKEQEQDSKNGDSAKDQQSKQDQQKNQDAQAHEQEKNDKKGEREKAPASAQAGPNLAPEDQWILQVLDQRESAEKKTNKELIRATIDQKLAGNDGKNCW